MYLTDLRSIQIYKIYTIKKEIPTQNGQKLYPYRQPTQHPRHVIELPNSNRVRPERWVVLSDIDPIFLPFFLKGDSMSVCEETDKEGGMTGRDTELQQEEKERGV